MTPPVQAAQRGARADVVHVVIHDGTTTAVVYVVDHHGSEIAIAVRSDLARDLRSALRLGEHPTLELDRHHVLRGFPGWPA